MEINQPGSLSNSPLQEILEQLNVVRGPDARGEYIAWCPFHADGQGSPPHQPNLQVSERGFICHACGAKGGLGQLVEKLGIRIRTAIVVDQVTYDYVDEDGTLLYQVVRLPGKRFFQRRSDGRGGWINDLKGVRRVLYHLSELRERPDEPVYIVEGEKDADRLRSLGLIATTNSGGAGKWHDAYSDALKNRDVIIIPDNDEPGRNHSESVARSLQGKAKSIKVVPLPQVDPKGDVSDFLDSGKTGIDLQKLVAETEEWAANGGVTDDLPVGADSAPVSEGKKASLPTIMVQIAEQEGIELFHDERGGAYTRVHFEAGTRIVAVKSREFETYLGQLTWARTRKAAGSEAIRAAKGVLEGKAIYEGPEHPLHCRVVRFQGDIWIDIDGVRAIKVSPGHWEIVVDPPILFRPNPHNRPLPDPIRGGNPHDILKFTKIEDPQLAVLFICYLVATLYPEVPCPLLIVHGVQGAAKSTLLRMIKRLVDPHVVEIRGLPRDVGEYALLAWLNRCLAFDNLTSIPQWLSDGLCRTVTGDGMEKRMLFSDDTPLVYKFQRVLLLAGINLVAQNPDLLDRSIIIELAPIQQEQRRPESEFWEEFDLAAPAIFGGILDALARVLEILPSVHLDHYPRMADFAKVGVAAAIALGHTPNEFLTAYGKNTRRQSDAAMETSVVAQTVLDLMDGQDGWSGTAGDLLGELEAIAQGLHINTKHHSWPKSPNILSRRLTELEPPLRAWGIEVEHGRSSTKRRVTIRRIKVEAVTTAPYSPDPVTAMTIHDDPVKSVVMQQPIVYPEEIAGRDDKGDITLLLSGLKELPMNPKEWLPDLQRYWQSIAEQLRTEGDGQMLSAHHAKLAIQDLWNQLRESPKNAQ